MKRRKHLVSRIKPEPTREQKYKFSKDLFILTEGQYFGEPRWTPYFDTLDQYELSNIDAIDHGMSMRIYGVSECDKSVFIELKDIRKVCIIRYDDGHVKGLKLA